MSLPNKTPIFKAGQRYKLVPHAVLVERTIQRPNLEGGADTILLSGYELLQGIVGEDGVEHQFIDTRHIQPGVEIRSIEPQLQLRPPLPLQRLLEHFEIPDVEDVARARPEIYAQHCRHLKEIQRFIQETVDAEFSFRNFQLDDLPRGAVHDGCILSWHTGLGKSIAGVVFALLKVGVDWIRSHAHSGLQPLKPVLMVAPETLHGQLEQEWKKRFGLHVIRLNSQATYRALIADTGKLSPGFYLSSYTQLGINKIECLPVPNQCPRTCDDIARLIHFYGGNLDDVCAVPGNEPLMEKAVKLCQERFDHWSEGVGEESRDGIRCIFGPSLADECGHEFDAVVVDEGTRIKGEDTKIGRSIRSLRPRCRCVLTATPLKNLLLDMFHLLHWVADGGEDRRARFPYERDQQAKFASDFNVCERNLSAEQRKAKEKAREQGKRERKPRKASKRSRGTPGVMVCNLHKLWKIVTPLILRRRKTDIGEDIVGVNKQIVRVPMGAEQYEVYRYHLTANYQSENEQPAYMAKLQALRSAASAPHSPLLKQLQTSLEGVGNGRYRSTSDYIPKVAACLKIIEQRLRAGEQTVVFSALHEPLDTLGRRLAAAGIPHDVLDGRMPPGKRGELAADFRLGLPVAKPVLLAGLKAMGEGHNWPRCNNVITLAYDWAYDLNAQAPERCRRLDSVKDLNLFAIVCDGSIDGKMEAGYDEKGDAADLVLDGDLMAEAGEELNLYELLQLAVEDFKRATAHPESALEREWPELRSQLGSAWEACQRLNGRIVKTIPATEPISVEWLLQQLKAQEQTV